MKLPTPPRSYATDPAVPAFDDRAAIVIFDGHCVLCSTGVQWMMARDPHGSTRFAAVQQPIARAIYGHYGLNADTFDTFLVIADGHAYSKWAGTLAAARTLPAPWRWLGIAGQLIPERLGDWLYDVVQQNRIRWFGARDVCKRPSPSDAHRWLEPAGQ